MSTIVFVQSFPVGASGGGGGRILRRLTEGMLDDVRFVCTSETRPDSFLPNETWMPTRPSMGRIDHSRFRWAACCLENFTLSSFERRILEYLVRENARAVHVLPHHNMDYTAVARVAARLKLPLFCSVHDDTRYVNRGRKDRRKMEQGVQMVWRQAAARFVICPEIGIEYNRRYGERAWQVVTDGLDRGELDGLADRPTSGSGRISPYFMGLFHNAYRENLSSFLKAVDTLRKDSFPIINCMELRCGSLSRMTYEGETELVVLPFSSQEAVRCDMEKADLLYLPLPFGDEYRDFVKYSFSTKLISYLGSGKVILYHGPEDAALAGYLRRTKAGICAYSLNSDEVAAVIARFWGSSQRRRDVVGNAQIAARADFNFQRIKCAFWDSIHRV